MKKAIKLTTTLLSVCALSVFSINCGGDHDHDHEGHDHDADGHHEEGSKEGGDESAAAPPAADNYPLKVCVVSGEALDSMGEPFVIKHEGTTVKFCCDSCVDDFKKNPAPFLAKLAVATK